MSTPIILASSSEIRLRLLSRARVPVETIPARIDEAAIREGLSAEGIGARDMADALAEAKARRVSAKLPDRIVLGCDQILWFKSEILAKPETPAEAKDQIRLLSGQTHQLYSAAVIFEDGRPVWRHVSTVRMRMRPLGQDYLTDYVTRNWESIRHSVGGYKLEEEGIRLFERIEGDYFAVLGLPLTELLNYLTLRRILPG